MATYFILICKERSLCIRNKSF